ncbi:MAG: acetolactate synthase [Candidatus Rokuibacteriota bacterium]|nr:MAG: acetolactate synthase [Candidatus Rokubacteria bacterium]
MSTGNASRTGGEWVVEALRAEGVRHVFGIPGVHNLAIYDALLRQSAIGHILARHEQGAGFMADGYARSSGEPGVVIVTTGPGATNTLTPLAESYAGSIPVLVVMSDIPAALVGRDLGALHEVVNQIDCFRPVCRWAEEILDGGAIAGDIQGAFDLFASGRPGPIALSIPVDLLSARGGGRIVEGRGRGRPPCHVEEIDAAARLLASARRPLIISGGGAVAADAGGELRRLAYRLGAPVITTVMGRGIIPETDALWQGVLPNKRATEEAIRAADVILAVGCRFAHRSTQGLLLNLSFSPDQTLIHLDIDPSVIGKIFKPRLGIVGDARDGLARLADLLGPGRSRAEWDVERLRVLKTSANERYTPEVADFIRVLRGALADDAIVVNDQTGVNYWMEWFFPVLAPRTFLYPVGSATLGYGVPAAIGAKVANPRRQVVAVVGDGGFLYSVNELATAVKYGLGIVFLVLNDARYGAITYLQVNPDFPALARAFGAAGARVDSPAALGSALARALAEPGPTVLELPVAVEPPWEL